MSCPGSTGCRISQQEFVKNERGVKARSKAPRAGGGFLGEGQPGPLHQLAFWRSTVSSALKSGAEPIKGFLAFYGCPMASPVA